jgi:hypothetical protein
MIKAMNPRRIVVALAVCALAASATSIASAQTIQISGPTSGDSAGQDLTCRPETGTEKYFPHLTRNSVVTVGGVQYYNLYGTLCADVEAKKVAASGMCVLKDGKPACQALVCDGGECKTPDIAVDSTPKNLADDSVGLKPPEVTGGSTEKRSILDTAFNPTPVGDFKNTLSGGVSGEKTLDAIKEVSSVDEGGFIEAARDTAKNTWSDVKTLFSGTPSAEEAARLTGGSESGARPVETTREESRRESTFAAGTGSSGRASDTACGAWCATKRYVSSAVESTKNAARYAYESIIPGAQAQPLDETAGQSIIEATQIVCKVRGCDADTLAKALAGSCVQESQCDPTRTHTYAGGSASQYQGLGQLSKTGVTQSYLELLELRDSGALTAEERQKINSVLAKTTAWIAGDKDAGDPRFDPEAGAYLFAARHSQMTPPEWGSEFSPIKNIQDRAPGDAKTQAKLIQLTQLAPSIHTTGHISDWNKTLTPTQRAAFANNALSGVRTVNEALTKMETSDAYGKNLPKGIAWMTETQADITGSIAKNQDPYTYGPADASAFDRLAYVPQPMARPKDVVLDGVESRVPEFSVAEQTSGLAGGAQPEARTVITQPVLNEAVPHLSATPAARVASFDLPPISSTERMRSYVSELAAESKLNAQAAAQADLMEQNAVVEAQYAEERQLQIDQERAYQARLAEAQRDTATAQAELMARNSAAETAYEEERQLRLEINRIQAERETAAAQADLLERNAVTEAAFAEAEQARLAEERALRARFEEAERATARAQADLLEQNIVAEAAYAEERQLQIDQERAYQARLLEAERAEFESRAAAQARLLDQNVITEAEYAENRQALIDQNRAYLARVAQAERDEAIYNETVRLAGGDAFGSGVELTPAQVQAAYVAEAERIKREAISQGGSSVEVDYAEFYDRVGVPKESDLRGYDPTVVGAIERAREEARIEEQQAFQRYEATKLDAEIAELKGERSCETVGFISCPVDQAARALQTAQVRRFDVETRYEACLAGNCPADVQQAVAEAQKAPGAATAWLTATEENFTKDYERRLQALKDGTLLSPIHVVGVLTDPVVIATAKGVRVIGNSIPGSQSFGFSEASDAAITRAFNPNKALEEDIKAVRDLTTVWVPVGGDVALGSKAIASIGGWTSRGIGTEAAVPQIAGFTRTEVATGADIVPFRQTASEVVAREQNAIIADRIAVNDTPVVRQPPSSAPSSASIADDAVVAGREVVESGPTITVRPANDNIPSGQFDVARIPEGEFLVPRGTASEAGVARQAEPLPAPSLPRSTASWTQVDDAIAQMRAAAGREPYVGATQADWAAVARIENAAARSSNDVSLYPNATRADWDQVALQSDRIVGPSYTRVDDVYPNTSIDEWQRIAQLENRAAAQSLPSPNYISTANVTRSPQITPGLAMEVRGGPALVGDVPSVSRTAPEVRISDIATPPVTPNVPGVNPLAEAAPVVNRTVPERISDTHASVRDIFRGPDTSPTPATTPLAPARQAIDDIADSAPALRDSRVTVYESSPSALRDDIANIAIPRDRAVTITALKHESAPLNADLVTVRLTDDASNLRINGEQLTTDASGRVTEVRVARRDLGALERGESGVIVYTKPEVPTARAVDVQDALTELRAAPPTFTERVRSWLGINRQTLTPVPQVTARSFDEPLGAGAPAIVDDFQLPGSTRYDTPTSPTPPPRITAPAERIDAALGADAPAIADNFAVPGARAFDDVVAPPGAVPSGGTAGQVVGPGTGATAASPSAAGTVASIAGKTALAPVKACWYVGLGKCAAAGIVGYGVYAFSSNSLPTPIQTRLGSVLPSGAQPAGGATVSGAVLPSTSATQAPLAIEFPSGDTIRPDVAKAAEEITRARQPAAQVPPPERQAAGQGGAPDGSYYCVTSVLPLNIVRLTPGTSFPTGRCYNNSGAASGAAPSAFGGMIGSLAATLFGSQSSGSASQAPAQTTPGVPTAPAQPKPAQSAVTIVANPSTVSPGESATLSWSATGPATCTVFDESGEKIGEGKPNPDPEKPLKVTPSKTTTYKTTCTGGTGTANGEVVVTVFTQ